MATSSIERNINEVIQQITAALKDAAEITVSTKFVEVEPNAATEPAAAKLLAQTIIRLDGDYDAIVPMRKNADGNVQIDDTLLELHREHVRQAREYRDGLLQILLGVVRPGSSSE
jgi:isocitrate dehydrogenase kinase/phosphatase